MKPKCVYLASSSPDIRLSDYPVEQVKAMMIHFESLRNTMERQMKRRARQGEPFAKAWLIKAERRSKKLDALAKKIAFEAWGIE